MNTSIRLHFSRDETPEILAKTELETFASWWRRLAEPRPPGAKEAAEPSADEMTSHAFVYALTGDRDRAELARQHLALAIAEPHWDDMFAGEVPLGGLQAAQITRAVALALDWLGDFLPEGDKRLALAALAEKGVEPCARMLYGMAQPETARDWRFASPRASELDLSRWPEILGHCNWQAVVACGCGFGALMLRATGHARAEEWLGLALGGMRHYATLYAADGSYIEGATYWSFGTSHLLMLAEALRRSGDADLYEELAWWLRRTIEFGVCMRMPYEGDQDLYGTVPFGDSGWRSNSMIGCVLARRFRDPLAQWAALNPPGRHSTESLIWYDSSIEPLPEPPAHLLRRRFDIDWVTARTGWNRDDLLFAFRSGPPGNHEHADRNSFVLNQYGERLLVDCGGSSYERTDPGWEMRLTAAHNCVLIDGYGHEYIGGTEGTNASAATARIVGYHDCAEYLALVSDTTTAYKGATLVRRTVVYFAAGLLVVIDELGAASPSIFTARFHTDNTDGQASRQVDGCSATIHRPRGSLLLKAAADTPIVLESGAHSIGDQKDCYRFVGVKTAGSQARATLAILLVPFAAGQDGPHASLQPEAGGWRASARGVDAVIRTRGVAAHSTEAAAEVRIEAPVLDHRSRDQED